uniref:hypothetical protein n=1 Tax=Nocardia suismassiliense TaxID=2077092 RepID=UPI003F499470
MPDDREVIESRDFPAGDSIGEPETGPKITPQFLAFVQQALSGRLPDPGDVPEVDPQVRTLAEELSVIHLPEWLNPAGRKLAEPTITSIKQAVRIADYLVRRGVRIHPELEQIRWAPTPGGLSGPFDTGLHITKDEHGHWPVLDPETFYDVADIEVAQRDDGTWYAAHPRGIAFEAATKTDAYAGLVDRLRQRITEATQS